jgi:hypothetical protein
LVGDGVTSGSTELSGVVSRDGVGERVTVAIPAAAAVLVGELVSVVAGVLVGGLTASGVRVEVAVGIEVGVLVGSGGLVAVGKVG